MEGWGIILGVVGYGVVGKAITEGFESLGHMVMVHDRDEEKSKFTKRELVEECEIIFVCVPTPTIDLGCDLRHVYDAVGQLHVQIAEVSRSSEGTSMPVVVIKSTVLPGTTETLQAMYPFVAHNPEFLRADSAGHDFMNPDRIVVGASSDRVIKKMKELYNDTDWAMIPKLYMSARDAELTKYLSNIYLVNKVAFSQEAARICKLLRADVGAVMDGVVMDKRIHPSHLDPMRGAISPDSPCLPKDLEALTIHLYKANHDTTFLESIYNLGVDIGEPKREAIAEIIHETRHEDLVDFEIAGLILERLEAIR